MKSRLRAPARLARGLRGDAGRAWIVFAIALLVRLAYAMPRAEIPVVNDMGVYDQLAFNMLVGEGYVSQLEPHFVAFRAPGYAFFLAAHYWAFGHAAGPPIFSQCLIGALTCVGILAIGRQLFDERTAILAASLCTIDPQMLHWTSKLLTETLFIGLVVLFVWLGVRLRATWARSRLVALGVTLGLALLVRPTLLAFLPVLVPLLLLWAPGRPAHKALRACAPVLVAALVLTPWTIRNYRLLGEIVPVATIGGISLYVGNPHAPPEDGPRRRQQTWKYLEAGVHRLPNGYDLVPELFGKRPRRPMPDDFSETEQSALGRQIFLETVRDDPVGFARLIGTKASLAFNPLPRRYKVAAHVQYGFQEYDPVFRWWSALFMFCTFLLAPLGLLVTFDKRSAVLLPALLVLFHVGLQLLFRPAHRYFLPGLVLASLFTAAGACAIPRLKRELRARMPSAQVIAGVWGALALALVANTTYQLWGLRAQRVRNDFEFFARLLGLD